MLEYDGNFLFKVIRVNQQLVSPRRRQPQLDTEQRYCVSSRDLKGQKHIFVVNASLTKPLNVVT